MSVADLEPRAVDSATFDTEVVERSRVLPVLVDFWAAWCGPCRMLAPVVARLAVEYAGRADVVKVDTDAEPALAARFGVRSLPTLGVFRHGELADAVVGAQPEGVLRELIDRHVERPGDAERLAAVAAAAAGNIDAALATLERLAAAEPARAAHFLALLDVLIDAGRLADAAQRIAHAPVSFEGDVHFEARRARLEITRAAHQPPTGEANAQLHAAAAREFLAGEHAVALDRWLELMQAAPRFGDGAAQRALRAAFRLLGEHDEIVVKSRRRMAALMH